MNSTLTGAVAIYLTQVRAELSDLPPGELEDVLQDVTDHLTEVAGEFDDEPTLSDLQVRLGTPRQYADELRAAAGYPARSEPVSQDYLASGWKALRWGLIAGTVGPFFVAVSIFAWSHDETAFFGLLGLGVLFVAAFLGVRALHGNDPRIVLDTPRGAQWATAVRGWIDQIPPNVRHELVTIGQPVWWVARGMIGAGGFFALFGAASVTVVGAVAGAAVSIWIGRRTQQDRRWLWYVVPLNVVAAVAIPSFLAAAYVGASFGFLNNYNDYRGSARGYEPPTKGVVVDGTTVSNIYPFDAQGKQVAVRLYDQDGNPISMELQDCATSYGQASRDTTSNLFPQVVVVPDENGDTSPDNCKETTKAPFVPPPAPATRTTSPTPTVAPTTVKPTGTPGVTLTVQPTR
ncbi:HAAS signaling domain-containing protein [Kribbella sindirgiensis]|uniref:Uncharacterized protein n=1 Tax=Kribbella sindirgiensis TaxID=1124744 RepID=A0A4V2M280_9ACTN|nr:hypothetical protein [Kribbella sindirgiensis]TCC23286.1 hypothetical protein E0H50_34445 [Kribbella sindirgiensis]